MKTVFCQSNFATPEQMYGLTRQHNIGYENIQFIWGNYADYSVIFNQATQPYNKENSFYFQCEPAPIRGGWSADVKYDFRISNHQMPIFLGFRSPKTWKEISQPCIKTKQICSILSGKNYLEGHIKRNSFAHMLETIPGFDSFGTFSNKPVDDKYDTLPQYKYTFNAENFVEPNYFTEKLTDAILCECLCFYWGCPNVDKFIDPRCYIRLDLDKPKEALETVKCAMADGEWEKRIDAIREEKRKIIFEKQIFAWLDKFIGNIKTPLV